MPIMRWWDGDPEERYWLEITDREDLGADLHAPKRDGSGNEYWSYSLVAEVNEGDVVLHWWKRAGGEPAFVGRSLAVGSVQTSSIVWNAHGTVGRARGETSARQPSWRFPLEGFTEFQEPITLAEVRSVEGKLRSAHEYLSLTTSHPLYFPFAFSDKRPLRTAQGYLVKFPADLIPVVPGLASALGQGTSSGASSGNSTPTPGQSPGAYMTDAVLRRALEVHAVERVMAHLTGQGYSCQNVGAARPYDVLAVREDEELHVEVKGSSGNKLTVELTDGEVKHARTTQPTLLAVVDAIGWQRNGYEVTCSGGRLRFWWDWVPAQSSLVATQWRYLLPPDDEVVE